MFELRCGRKNPSEGGSWQRGDNVWRRALPPPDNFFFLNLMSIFLYTGAVVEIINLGLSRKKHLGRADYMDVLITGTAALLFLSRPKLLLFVSLSQFLFILLFFPPLHFPLMFLSFAVFFEGPLHQISDTNHYHYQQWRRAMHSLRYLKLLQ